MYYLNKSHNSLYKSCDSSTRKWSKRVKWFYIYIYIYICMYINNTLDDFINHHIMGWWNFPLTWFRTKLSNNFSFKQSG